MGEEEFKDYLEKKNKTANKKEIDSMRMDTRKEKKVPRRLNSLALFLIMVLNTLEMAVKVVIALMLIITIIVGSDMLRKLTEYYYIAQQDIGENELEVVSEKKPTNVYDSDGSLIVTLTNGEEQLFADFNEIPNEVGYAFVAVEDRNFATHKGIDVKGLARVAVNYFKSSGEEVAGASTITQQLVRNTYLTKEVTVERKLKEMCYSIVLEENYSKKEILKYYINNIYFANGYYGIKTAANGYFQKKLSELSLSEIAYLCAIPNSPTYYDPIKNNEHVIERRNKILKDMLECGYITSEDCELALNEEIKLKVKSKESNNNFVSPFSSYATYELVLWSMKKNGFNFEYEWESTEEYKKYQKKFNEVYEEELANIKVQGLEVKTSLNKEIQRKMQQALDSELSLIDNTIGDNGIYELQGASTCIDNRTGKVVGILSGRSQDGVQNLLNRGYMGYRQPGSSLKPLVVYTTALESGYTKDSKIVNMDIKKFNKTGEIIGSEVQLEEAVVWSKNGCAYYLMNSVTPREAIRKLSKMKFNRIVPDDYYISSSLGGLTYGVTTLEMSSAYSCLVNGGEYTRGTCLSEIYKNGKQIYTGEVRENIYTEKASFEMLDILREVVIRGTAKGMHWNNDVAEVAGKTGTTNDNKDGWFCGVSQEYSLSVWVGYDKPKELTELMGGTYPANIFKKTMEEITVVQGNKLVTTAKVEIKLDTNAEDVTEELMPGRASDELLSDGYTVGDYRADQKLVEKAEKLIDKAIKENSDKYNSQINELISQIKSRKAIERLRDSLSEIGGAISDNDSQ